MQKTGANILRFGSRTSQLALRQTNQVLNHLVHLNPDLDCEVVPFITKGDRTLDKPLPEIGGKGLFTFELETALLAGEIDLVVHSLKDLPTVQRPGLVVGAIPPRGSAEDVLILDQGLDMGEIESEARIGTSSLRRKAQLNRIYPGVDVVPIRGNVPTRIQKVMEGPYDGIVLAAAGLERLDLDHHISRRFSIDQMMPAPGQGALGVQCREDDVELRALLELIHDNDTGHAVMAERFFLNKLGGGCAAPVGAYACIEADRRSIRLCGVVLSPDGAEFVRVEASDVDPELLGVKLAEEALREGADRLLHLAGVVNTG